MKKINKKLFLTLFFMFFVCLASFFIFQNVFYSMFFPVKKHEAIESSTTYNTKEKLELLSSGLLKDMVIGREDAPVTIIEYSSLTCYHCADFEKMIFPLLKEKYIDTGKVRFIFREFAFDSRSEAGFMLARCQQDKYFTIINMLFKSHEALVTEKNARDLLLNLYKQAGFSEEQFKACLSNEKLLEDIRAVRDKAQKELSITGTPTFFINGTQYTGKMSIEEFSKIIDQQI